MGHKHIKNMPFPQGILQFSNFQRTINCGSKNAPLPNKQDVKTPQRDNLSFWTLAIIC